MIFRTCGHSLFDGSDEAVTLSGEELTVEQPAQDVLRDFLWFV